jgi:hypothetical protein
MKRDVLLLKIRDNQAAAFVLPQNNAVHHVRTYV